DRGPRVVDDGQDTLGRDYSDAAINALGASSVQGAGGLTDSWLGDTRSLDYAPQSFTTGDGTVGGAPRSATVRPKPEAYDMLAENGQPGEGVFGGAMVRTADGMCLLRPEVSGIAEASAFRPLGSDTSKGMYDETEDEEKDADEDDGKGKSKARK